MIKTLQLRFGRHPGSAPERVQLTPITVFVGPNYSGKSKVLQEIQQYVTTGQPGPLDLILDQLEFAGLEPDEAETRVASLTVRPQRDEILLPDHVFIGKRRYRQQVPRVRMVNSLINPTDDQGAFCSWYLALNTMILDGKSRIDLVQAQAAGDLQLQAQNALQLLFRDDNRREELRRIIHEAFNVYPVVDPTNLGHLRLRLSQVEPPSHMIERGIHEDAVRFHCEATPIELASDGLKAFTGIMMEVIAGNPLVLLLDEPEAFLHPALSFVLGREVARAMTNTDGRLFVSTHSPTFLMGCIQSGVPITVIRLTYRAGVATARILPSTEILKLMRNPLLRSTGVLSAVFYENVVVTESDADRAFYHEINERLLRDRPGSGIQNCLFINAQNKQTVPIILRPLRQLGIPAIGIVDVDIFKEGGTVWVTMLNGACLPEIEQQALAHTRAALKARFDETGRNMKREGGLALLTGAAREAAENLLGSLATYGVFVVPGGELESWLKNLGATGHGPTWLVNMFERLGEDPEDPSYIRPAAGDVWDFVASFREWFGDPNRRGIPP